MQELYSKYQTLYDYLCYNEFTISELFRNVHNISVHEYIVRRRMMLEAKKMLGTLFSKQISTDEMLSMHKKGYTLEQIADVAEKSIEEIEAIIKEKEPVLA